MKTEIKAENITLVDIDSIVINPKNNNKHSEKQIERLVKLIKHNGFRVPLIVSNRSGFLITGHARLDAAKKAGLEMLPVIFQDFVNEAEEYQFLTADNEIARWSELDLEAVKFEIEEFEGLDWELLGLRELLISPDENPLDDLEDSEEKEKKYLLQVQFPNDMELADVRDELLSRGYIVKVL